jgi:hypothetical protein
MRGISRRQFGAGLSSLAVAGASRAWGKDEKAQEEAEGRIAIIDTSHDTRPWLGELERRNVRVVARYFARGCQAIVPRKRIAFNGKPYQCAGTAYAAGGTPEASQLLASGFAILSIYQFNSSEPRKFLFGLDTDGNAVETGSRDTDHEDRARMEAFADAQAALEQAESIGQPNGTAIYFGVDFNLRQGGGRIEFARGGKRITAKYDDGTPVDNTQLEAACLAYFAALKERIGNRYRLGAYGNGHTNDLLRARRLVDYSWVSESRSFHKTAQFLRKGDWHLFQNQIDRHWFVSGRDCSTGLDLDTNIQNPKYEDVGAWDAAGLARVPPQRTRRIFEQRRVAIKDVAVLARKEKASPQGSGGRCRNRRWSVASMADRNRTVRVLEVDGPWLRIDLDEDGVADGYCFDGGNFAASIKAMPDW